MNNPTPISFESPVRIYPDGAAWCALLGEDIMEGLSGFGRSPEEALENLLKQDEFWEHAPHGVWDLVCPGCGHRAAHIMPFPFPGDFIECHLCKTEIPISSDPPSLG